MLSAVRSPVRVQGRGELRDDLVEILRSNGDGRLIKGLTDAEPGAPPPFTESGVSAEHVAEPRGVQIVGGLQHEIAVDYDMIKVDPGPRAAGADGLVAVPLGENAVDDSAGRDDRRDQHQRHPLLQRDVLGRVEGYPPSDPDDEPNFVWYLVSDFLKVGPVQQPSVFDPCRLSGQVRAGRVVGAGELTAK